MEIQLVAYAPRDAWGFCAMEGNTFVVRPPFRSSDLIQVSQSTVRMALRSPGFEECSMKFGNLAALVHFLKDEYLEMKKARKTDLPTREELRELLEDASDSILAGYLKKANLELVPRGRLDAAETIVDELMRLERVRQNPELANLCLEVLLECCRQRNSLPGLRHAISRDRQESWVEKFPAALMVYPIVSLISGQDSVCRRGRLLRVGE